jgi:DNA-nicking Smr family endonuclease
MYISHLNSNDIFQVMFEEILKIDFGDELDLHCFHPKDVKGLINDFIYDAASKGKTTVRIIHGKGRSVLKAIMQKELEKNSRIAGFMDDHGNWGATIVHIKPE